jgi:hypothetical protein
MRIAFVFVCLSLLSPAPSRAAEADAAGYLKGLKAVGNEGAGNAEAAVAWKRLVAIGGDALFPTLVALDDARPVAANWLRLAAQAIVEKEREAKRPLAADKLEAFVRDIKHAPISRRLAYEFLVEADAKAPERLLPSMIEDPSVEIRRDAIAAAIEKSTPLIKSDPKQATVEFERLFRASRDQDQTEKIAKTLKELNATADLNQHFGVITDWMLAGPFDSTQGAGYEKAYDPEAGVDLKAAFKGKAGMAVKWAPHSSTEPYGLVDLNKAIGKNMDAAAYAFTSIEADKELPVEIRFGCISAVKVFLNGKEVFAREEYHHGQRFDQYLATGVLKPGRNELLLKVCQNNQTENWAQDWKFQLRLCDATGGALPIKAMKVKSSAAEVKGN